jgi:very-short-patch-repair endonuclease
MTARTNTVPLDMTIAELAERQYGVVARRQLIAAGARRWEVEARLARRSLLVLHRGVYAVGHRRLTQDGRWLAAVLAAGPGAALSHRDAALLHGIGRWTTGRIEVTSPRQVAPLAGIRLYARRRLASADLTVVAGIPVTTVERTLVDLAEVVSHDRLLHALSETERLRSADRHALQQAVERVRNRPGPGHARLRAALVEHRREGVTLTRSDLERALRAIVREHGLPPAELNVHVDGMEVDALWRGQRVAVECDSWRWHSGRRAFRNDRVKSNRLGLQGWLVLRFTDADVADRPHAVAAEIAAALASRSP